MKRTTITRFSRAAAATLAVVATTLAVAFAAPAPAVRYAQPSTSSLMGIARGPERLAEALRAAEWLKMRAGLIDPAKAQDAFRSAQAEAAAIRPATGVLGRAWRELGPKPYVTDDSTYNDIVGGTAPLGWGVVSGRVTTMALDPSDATGRTVWIGTAGGGVWRTRDAGAHWSALWDGKPSLAIGAIAFDRARPRNVYVGTGEGNMGGGTMFRGDGVYRSTDGGKTFVRPSKNVKANIISHIEAVNGIVFVSTDNGLWRSADAGASFSDVRLPTNQAGTAPQSGLLTNVVTDVKVHPGRANEVTAAVGWPRGKLYGPGNGLYRSTKSGAPGTWTRMDVSGLKSGSKTDDPIGRITLGYATGKDQNHDVLWAIVQDAGLINGSWKEGLDDPIGSTVLNGVYRSGDDGTTWDLKATSESFSAAPGSALAALAPLGYAPGVQSWYNQWLLVSPTDENTVLVGLEEVYQTTANATSPGPAAWTTVGRYWNACLALVTTGCDAAPAGPYAGKTTHPDQHAAVLTADGTRLYVGNDGGVFTQRSDTGRFANTGWTSVNATLGTTQPYFATMAKDGTVYTGFQDNGTAKITPQGYGVAVFGGDGGDVAVHPDNPDWVWEEYVGAAMYRSKDGGKTWENNAPVTTSPQFIAPFELDPANADHLVVGAREILETDDAWNMTCRHEPLVTGRQVGPCGWKVSFDLGRNKAFDKGDPDDDLDLESSPGPNFSATAIDVQGAVVYAGYCGTCGLVSTDPSSDGKVKSGIATNRKNGCAPATGTDSCWHHASAKGLPNRFISDVTIDPRNPSVVYVTLGGYSRRWLPPTARTKNVGRGHVFVSRDAGETFKDISANLPDVPAESLAIKGDTLFVGTDMGAYVASKAGAAWERLGAGLPNAPVMDINLNPQATAIVVATHGRGVWSYDLSAATAKKKVPVRKITSKASGGAAATLSRSPAGAVASAARGTADGAPAGTGGALVIAAMAAVLTRRRVPRR